MINHPSHPRHQHLTRALRGLSRWTTRPSRFTTLAYEWCSVICEKYRELDNGEDLLFLSLEIGFRHLDPQREWMESGLTHSQHHQSMADIVFESRQGGVIADLLCAWTSRGPVHQPYMSLNICAKHLVDLRGLNSSSRLRPLVIRSIELIGHQGFGEVGVKNLVGLLNRLGVGIDDVDSRSSWTELLLEIIKSREGRDHLLYSYWELLVELSLPYYGDRQDLTSYDPRIMISLQDAQEWDRLACWNCFVWMEWTLHPDEVLGDLGRGTALLFHQRPDSVRRLEEWMERSGRDIPMVFRQICEQGHLEAEQRSVLL